MECERDDSVQNLFLKLTHLYFGKAYGILKETGIHPKQVPMLYLIGHKEGLSQREISTEMRITPPTVAVSIKRMEKSGLIERRADEKDQRMSHIYLTPKGKNLGEDVMRVAKESESVVLKGFSDSEICLLKRFFNQMIENLEQKN